MSQTIDCCSKMNKYRHDSDSSSVTFYWSLFFRDARYLSAWSLADKWSRWYEVVDLTSASSPHCVETNMSCGRLFQSFTITFPDVHDKSYEIIWAFLTLTQECEMIGRPISIIISYPAHLKAKFLKKNIFLQTVAKSEIWISVSCNSNFCLDNKQYKHRRGRSGKTEQTVKQHKK